MAGETVRAERRERRARLDRILAPLGYVRWHPPAWLGRLKGEIWLARARRTFVELLAARARTRGA